MPGDGIADLEVGAAGDAVADFPWPLGVEEIDDGADELQARGLNAKTLADLKIELANAVLSAVATGLDKRVTIEPVGVLP